MDVCTLISANGYIKYDLYHNSQSEKPVFVFCFHAEAVRKILFHTLGKPFSWCWKGFSALPNGLFGMAV